MREVGGGRVVYGCRRGGMVRGAGGRILFWFVFLFGGVREGVAERVADGIWVGVGWVEGGVEFEWEWALVGFGYSKGAGRLGVGFAFLSNQC